MVLLSIPAIQTALGSYATGKINDVYGTDIKIEKAGLQFNGDVELKSILIKDHFEAPMISVSELNTSVLNFAKMVNNELVFGDIDLYNLFFHIKTYKGESDTNLDIFVDKFDNQNPREYVAKFSLSSSSLNIYSSVFRLTDENKDSPVVLNFTDLNILATDFLISGPDIDANIKRLSFIDSRGLALKNIETVFSYTPTKMLFSDLGIRTDSSLVSGKLQFDYQREDLNSFSDKVIISGFFENSSLDLGEFNLLYDEFGDNQKAQLNTTFSGTLKDLKFEEFNLKTNSNTSIIGRFHVNELFDSSSGGFLLDGEFDAISSSYEELT